MSPTNSTTAVVYPHRKNYDGTWDAVCPVCCKTIARAELETSLFDLEAGHQCALKSAS